MLVPCESCRRHLRAGDLVCPFCKASRTTSKLAAVALSSVIVLAGCDNVTTGAKYGGPPPSFKPDPPTSVSSEAPTTPTTPTPTTPTTPTADAPPPDAAARDAGSPRLGDRKPIENSAKDAPAPAYGGPPRR